MGFGSFCVDFIHHWFSDLEKGIYEVLFIELEVSSFMYNIKIRQADAPGSVSIAKTKPAVAITTTKVATTMYLGRSVESAPSAIVEVFTFPFIYRRFSKLTAQSNHAFDVVTLTGKKDGCA